MVPLELYMLLGITILIGVKDIGWLIKQEHGTNQRVIKNLSAPKRIGFKMQQ